MKKEFVKCKIERCTHRKGGPAVKINDSFPKRLLDFDPVGSNQALISVFITHKKDSSEFKVCQLKADESGYYLLYSIKCRGVDYITEDIQEIQDDGYVGPRSLWLYVNRFIENTLIFERDEIKK